LHEDGSHVPKYDGNASVIFVPIKNVHFVGMINGVCWCKSVGMGSCKICTAECIRGWTIGKRKI